MRMEQYLTFTDHALWKVIVNGDSVSPVASASTGAEGPIPPKTAEQKLARKNEIKAKSTLMLAILDEKLLKFHACKDVKSLWEAIKNRFGGNKESKKMQKTILKKNYENFATSNQEGLDKTYDRFWYMPRDCKSSVEFPLRLRSSFYSTVLFAPNARSPPTNNRPVLPAALRARAVQELHELQKISAFVDSRLESIEGFLNNIAQQPNETDINDLSPDDVSVDNNLVSPFLSFR
ncbi:hypothetical protein Tco_1009704 [Tanacetum coccineum]